MPKHPPNQNPEDLTRQDRSTVLATSAPVLATAPWALPALLLVFLISGFAALLYQVVWQRLLGLFSGSDVRSVSVIVAAYLAGLGLGSFISGALSDRLSRFRAVQLYGYCSLGIGLFAACSRLLFYDLVFRQLRFLASLPWLSLLVVFVSLLIPTTLMGLSLPLLTRATSAQAEQAASRLGLLYGVNTLGSGLGSLIAGWVMIGTLGLERTLYIGAALSGLVGVVTLISARSLVGKPGTPPARPTPGGGVEPVPLPERYAHRGLTEWCGLVFCSGFVAIALEILWFRVLDVALQSIAYTYAHLLAFILISNGVGSLLGTRMVGWVRQPRQVFLWLQGVVIAYSALSLWLISLYWQAHPQLRADIGFIDTRQLTAELVIKYAVIPVLMLVVPNLLLGFYVPLVQQAIQTDQHRIGWRVGLIQVANILGNVAGSLVTGLVLLHWWGTALSLRLLLLVGLGFVLLTYAGGRGLKAAIGLTALLVALAIGFPNNTRLWAALHSVPSNQYFWVAEDSTGIAAVTEADGRGTLLASGQAQAQFPYMQAHVLLGTVPALLHPHPERLLIIGLGSGGTPHTLGVNPVTQEIRVVELLGPELPVLRDYAQTALGQPLKFLFQDPRYIFVIGDGRRELALSQERFDLIEADAINPWRSRAGMLYSQEFFQEVLSRLAPAGMSVQWNVGPRTEQTFRSVFPHVVRLDMTNNLSVLLGSATPIVFDRDSLLAKLEQPEVRQFLAQAGVDIPVLRGHLLATTVHYFSQVEHGRPEPVDTDLFPRSEYYLNQIQTR